VLLSRPLSGGRPEGALVIAESGADARLGGSGWTIGLVGAIAC
jgi:hypothetical protein